MPLEKWNPLRELETMRREMDRIWDDVFPSRKMVLPWKRQPGAQAESGAATPAIDVIDKNDSVVVKAEMPGVSKESIDVTLEDNVITLRGELREESDLKEGNYAYSERNYRYFLRAISIPFKIRRDGIKASLKDGVLSVFLPKAVEEQTKKITVEVSGQS